MPTPSVTPRPFDDPQFKVELQNARLCLDEARNTTNWELAYCNLELAIDNILNAHRIACKSAQQDGVRG